MGYIEYNKIQVYLQHHYAISRIHFYKTDAAAPFGLFDKNLGQHAIY